MSGKIFLSAFTGFLFGLMGYFVLRLTKEPQAFVLAALGGALFAILLFVYLVVHGYVMEKRYAKFEKGMTESVICKANGNIRFQNGSMKNGNLYFCETSVIIVCAENKPYLREEIPLENIADITYGLAQLNIVTMDRGVFAITLPNADKIAALLAGGGWPVSGQV